MKWFRLYSEVLDDPKVQQLHPAMFKHWINLLCLASQTDRDGLLPDEAAIAFRLRVRPTQVSTIIDALIDARLIDRVDCPAKPLQLFVHKWQDRQQKSDDVAQRVARHRAANQENVTLQETLQKRSRVEEDKNRQEESREDENTTRAGPREERFETFWSAYPRKVKKDAARKAFEKRKVDEALLLKMLAALDWQRTSPDWIKDGGQFIPHPSTWLNAAQWEDEQQQLKPFSFVAKTKAESMERLIAFTQAESEKHEHSRNGEVIDAQSRVVESITTRDPGRFRRGLGGGAE
jgi:hypothetical protein